MFTIKEWRRAKGKSQESMANALGVSLPTISRWEDDSSQITISNCYKIADFLGVKFEDIIFLPNTSNL